MATVTKLGPADHGRPMTLEEFDTGDFEPGYKYELIDGKLYVSPAPNLPEGFLEEWIGSKIREYRTAHPAVINYVCAKSRVFVPDRPEATVPEPDLAAYHDFPLDNWEEINWSEVSPILVVEILTGDDSAKDLVRNVELYLQVPTIKEYWIVDGRKPAHLRMHVYRRHGKRWKKPIELTDGDTYTTQLLPEFALTIDPRS